LKEKEDAYNSALSTAMMHSQKKTMMLQLPHTKKALLIKPGEQYLLISSLLSLQ
jgi:hypothetical protein